MKSKSLIIPDFSDFFRNPLLLDQKILQENNRKYREGMIKAVIKYHDKVQRNI